MQKHHFSTQELFQFIDLARKSTYIGGKSPRKKSERKDFIEFDFDKNEWSYLDSYIGYFRSTGQEVVRYKKEIVWVNSYSGGMIKGKERLADQTFNFLKEAMSQETPNFQSFRGPKSFNSKDWQYQYNQEGDVTNYRGLEEILYKNKVVFFHRTIGGVIISK